MNELTTYKKPAKKILKFLLLLVLILLLLRTFIFTKSTLKGNSMAPTLVDGDKVFTSSLLLKLSPKLKRGKLGSFKFKVENRFFVKRIIGLSGENLEIRYGTLYINGEKLREDYISSSIVTYGLGGPLEMRDAKDMGEYRFAYRNNFPDISIDLGPDEYFALGDNRFHSDDSRKFGPIKKNQIKKIVISVTLPTYDK